MKPTVKTYRHGAQQYGKDSNGKAVTTVYFKPTEKDSGCWVSENVYAELCFRRGFGAPK